MIPAPSSRLGSPFPSRRCPAAFIIASRWLPISFPSSLLSLRALLDSYPIQCLPITVLQDEPHHQQLMAFKRPSALSDNLACDCVPTKPKSPLEKTRGLDFDKDDLRCLDSNGNIRPPRIIRKWNVPILALVALMTGAKSMSDDFCAYGRDRPLSFRHRINKAALGVGLDWRSPKTSTERLRAHQFLLRQSLLTMKGRLFPIRDDDSSIRDASVTWARPTPIPT